MQYFPESDANANPNKEKTMTVTKETKLKNRDPRFTNGMPLDATFAEVVAAARRIWKKYHSTRVATYKSGKQVEVRCVRDGYHGRDLKLVACYDIVE
jgi:hypothetical protein